MQAEERFPPLTEKELKTARSLREKKYRDAAGAFLIEGARLCEEALSTGQRLRQIIVTAAAMTNGRIAELVDVCAAKNLFVSLAESAKFKSLSDEKTPSGIAIIVEKRKAEPSTTDAPLILAIDALQDPGNLGTILRTADWFGVERVLLGEGCVDLYNPKVVRATMGAVFRLKIEENVALTHRLAVLSHQGYRLIATSSSAELAISEIEPGRDVLIIGSEAHGVHQELLRRADVTFAIPKRGSGDSLNAAVAASICLYHFTQSRKPPFVA
jgi:RNA methyltransferase, TrmH family